MFFRKKVQEKKSYDRENQIPVVRSSICTGEKVAGFRDKQTGKFEEITCIHGERELEEFLDNYGILREELKKEW